MIATKGSAGRHLARSDAHPTEAEATSTPACGTAYRRTIVSIASLTSSFHSADVQARRTAPIGKRILSGFWREVTFFYVDAIDLQDLRIIAC
jgi:hypothetical protein